MSLIINFFGGPGIGKSTQAASLFGIMKRENFEVELTYEYPKIVAWEENLSAIKDQFFITANQHRNITRLYGKVKYIVVDSPIILGIIYKNMYLKSEEYPGAFYDENFDLFLLNLFKKYQNLNIFLRRNDNTYDNNGRFQTLQESKKIDEFLKQKLLDNNISFVEFDVNINTGYEIFEYILKNGY
jgi:hypothetical protein